MVKIIAGLKGSGKTKRLVDLVIDAVNNGDGDVVVIEKDRKLTFDIPYQARLIDAGVYDIGTVEFFKGMLCGIHSGNLLMFLLTTSLKCSTTGAMRL